MDAATSRPTVVIDNGSGYTKMGFAGNVEPCFIVPTVVAVNESFLNQSRSTNKSNWLAQHSAGVMADLDFFIGEEALAKSRSSSTYNLSYPIRQGQVDNWDAMERFWQQCIFNYLRCDPEDHYFLLTESPLTAPESREYTGEIMFETFNVPGLYIAVQPVLALAAGYTTSKCEMTGVVVDIGDGATHIVPVAEGYVIGSSIKSIPIAGKDVTLFIQQLMRERGENIPTEDSLEVARKVKETYCYTSSDIVKEYNKHDKEPSKYIKQWRGIKPRTGAPYSCDVGYERFLGPEVFFNPEIYSSDFTTPLPDVIDKCIQSAPIDTRRGVKIPPSSGSDNILIPGLPPLAPIDMPSVIYGQPKVLFDMVMNQYENVDKADWVLCNTFYKLDEEVVDWMTKHLPLRTIGPTLPSMYLDKQIQDDKSYGPSLFKPDSSVCMKWLNDKPNGSVVYVSFGSLATLQIEQMEELAWGLKGSNNYFMWVVRPLEEVKLPKNFVEAASEKGLVVSWCPQLEVLAHKAVGCFVTHCGWNSTLEALSLGVPMVAMPQWGDQTTNAKYLVDVWGVGLRTWRDDKGIVRREMVEDCIREAMEGEKGKEIKINASKWRDLAREALEEGESSDRNIDEFVSALGHSL